MSRQNDLKSQPKAGRYFPITFGDAVRLVKECGLIDYSGERIKIRMENTEQETKYGYPVADIVPEKDLALYSLPNRLPAKACEKLAVEAILKLSEIKKRRNNEDSTKFSYYCAYIEQSNGLRARITRKDVSLKRAKYRGDSKFSNAFNTNKRKVLEIEL